MPIRWDALLLRHLARELDDRLRGSRLRAVRLDGERRDLALLFREATLIWRLHPQRGYPVLLPAREPSDGDRPLSARVRRIEAPPDERYLRVELLPTRGRRRAVDVVVELLGNQWNAVVAEGPERRIRHVLVRKEGRRPFVVGELWRPPDPAGRQGIDGSPAAVPWDDICGDEVAERRRRLVSDVAWTSPLNAGHILGGPEAWHSTEEIARRWSDLADPVRPADPVVMELPRGGQPYPFPLEGAPHRRFESLLDAVEHVADAGDSADPGASVLLPPGLLGALEGALERTARREGRLRSELEQLDDPESLQARGDLLLARYGDVTLGSAEAALEDFAGNEVRIDLDPALSVHQNAAAYYGRAARTRRAKARLPGMISEAEERRELLEALLDAARAGDADEARIRTALGPEVDAAGSAGRRTPGGPSLPYHVFRSSGGLEIRVGRSAKRNADLTFRHSAPGDVWLHARHAAGAHVILRWDRPGSPPARDLHEAAVLAALNSKARTSGSVPVDWTLRKYVRKPRGAPAGTVVPERVKTVFVEPDPALPEALSPDR